jgi:putative sterol carrier protein
MTALDLIKKLPLALDQGAAANAHCTIQFNISTPAYAVIHKSVCEVTEGSTDSADLVLTLSDDDLIKLLTGQLDGVTAFMTGRLKIKGDLSLAQRLGRLFDANRLQ